MGLDDFIGKNATPTARLASTFISIAIVLFIFFNAMPTELRNGAFYFLLFHLANHIYVGYSDLKIHTCYRCGEELRPRVNYKKHICKKHGA